MGGHPRPLLLLLHLLLHLLLVLVLVLVLLLLLGRRAAATTKGKTLLATRTGPAIDAVVAIVIVSLVSMAVAGGSRAAACAGARGKGRGVVPGHVWQRREDFKLVATGVIVLKGRVGGGRRRGPGHGFLACVIVYKMGACVCRVSVGGMERAQRRRAADLKS
jgi:hypothetical protein